MAKLRQLLLLIWKNFKLQSRHPWVTLLELGVPAFFSLCLVLIRSAISSEYVTSPVVYDPFTIYSLPSNLTPPSGKTWQLLYTPRSVFLDEIMEDVATALKVKKEGFDDEDSMIEYYNTNATSLVLSGIVFKDDIKNSINNITNITYTVRPRTAEGGNSAFENTIKLWYTQYTFPLFPALGPRNREIVWGGSPGYMSQGFLTIQNAVADSFMKRLAPDPSKKDDIHLEMCRYPYPPYLDDKFVLALQLFFPMIICFSFIYPAEAMKMMGLSRWLHWTAWYFKYFVFLFLSCSIMTLLLCVKFSDNLSVINSSDPSVILLWLVTYTASIISFCFLLSTLFSKANSSAAGAGVIFFLTFIPYFFILPRYNQMSFPEKILSCLLPNIAIAMGSIVLTVSEASGSGLQWDNIGSPATPDDSLTMSTIFIMFLVDGIICLVLTWYVELVFPGEYGIPERWYFPFTRTYWCGQHTNFNEMMQFYSSDTKRSDYFERDPTDLMPGIQIQGLTKVYGKSNVPAANNVHLNMYRSHITVLLGHNGAGKSTTISMLTGLIPPTSGTALVNSFDICEDMNSVHSNLGICPQHDVLFDELTVDEHLYFFCKLKGYISDLVSADIDRIVTSLNLKEKRSTKVEALSGGWKRKLSVGVALVGGSRIVILDEPTSGMDPFNRRALWDVLQTEKEDRTILLTTHFMEEADILGDRIAIMANGEVQCCGSPLFLKKKYGAGYHLVMVKEPTCEVPPITNLVLSHVPTAEMSSNIGSELKYILPHDSSHLFHDLFEELERRKIELRISGYGASITTMEEVFIKVGSRSHLEDVLEIPLPTNTPKESLSAADSGIHVTNTDADSGTEIDLQSIDDRAEERNRNSGIRLFFQHLRALLEKRVLHSYRNWVLTLSQLILPPFFLILTILVLKTLPKPSDAPALPLTTDSYQGTEIPYLVDITSTESKAMADIFKSLFTTEWNQPVFLNSSQVDLTSYLINEAKNDLGKYNMHNMIAAKFRAAGGGKGTTITSLFNNQAYHSPAIALLQAHKTMLKYLTNSSFSFAVTNHPLPRTLSEKGKEQQTQTTESYQIAQDIMFGMAFLIASFAIFIIKERGSNSKHLQRVSGVNLFSYWLAAWMWDFLNYLIPCCLLIIIFASFGTEGLSTPPELGRLFLLFFVHGFSALPFVYCCTFFFMSPSTAYVRLSLFNILVGIACLLTITILEIPDLGVDYVAKPLDTVFSLLFPNYGLGRSISNLYQNKQFNKFCNTPEVAFYCDLEIEPIFDLVKPCCKGKCDSVCIPWEENYLSLSSPGIGRNLVFFALQFIIFTSLLIMCERNLMRYLKYKFKSGRVRPTEVSSEVQSFEIDVIEDDDVRNERLRILNLPIEALFQSNHIVIKEVSKKYGSFLAVNRLTFGVRKGECFGLLGLNGAGKTTTFKMITGDEAITSGDIFVNGYDIKKETRKVQGRIGYCPQSDALIDQLTGRETLTLFARLRGIKESGIAGQIIYLSELLTFHAHIDKLVKDYSGGNRRKLSTAIALIGNAPVIFLDEPTTGMDPVSRRSMWNALLQIMQSGRSVVLTSHSMEECEALCTRLVIMVNGKLCCLGSPQHLKSKFGRGFTLIIKVGQKPALSSLNPLKSTVRSSASSSASVSATASDVDEIRGFVERTFASAVLKSAHENLLHYHIPQPQLNWSEIFRAMEAAKGSLCIEDYSVGETTLEQVFLNFALVQRDAV